MNLWIFVKVRLLDLVDLEPGDVINKSALSGRHVDFVICSKFYAVPLLCIELNDSTHDSLAARLADDTKAEILKTAGIRLLTIQARKFYKAPELAGTVRAWLASDSFSEQKKTGEPFGSPKSSTASCACPELKPEKAPQLF